MHILQYDIGCTSDKQCLSVCRCFGHFLYYELCVMTFPKCTGGAPCVLLAFLLGAGDSGGHAKTVESSEMGESVICWLGLECGSAEASVSMNTLSDA